MEKDEKPEDNTIQKQFKDIKKMDPKERIRKLRELEKNLKKGIQNAEKIIKESSEEIDEQDESERKIPIEQLKAWNLQELFSPEAQLMWQNKRFKEKKDEETAEEKPKEPELESLEQELEESVWTVKKVQDEIQSQMYNAQKELAYQPMEELYSQVQSIYSSIQSGTATEDMVHDKYSLLGALEMKAQALDTGNYTSDTATGSEDIMNMLDGARRMLRYGSIESGYESRKHGPSDDLKQKPM